MVFAAVAGSALHRHAGCGPTAEAEQLDRERPSIGNHIYGAFGRDCGTSDGQHVMLAAISAGQWPAPVKACAIEREVSALERSLRPDFSREDARAPTAGLQSLAGPSFLHVREEREIGV